MSDLDEDEKQRRIAETLRALKPLAATYYQLTGKPLGVTGELAEQAAAEKLPGLRLTDAREEGHDALRGEERIQIKGRCFTPTSWAGQRIGRLKADTKCDTVLLVILDPRTLEASAIWEAPFQVVRDQLAQLPQAEQARGLPLVSFRKLARQVWPATA